MPPGASHVLADLTGFPALLREITVGSGRDSSIAWYDVVPSNELRSAVPTGRVKWYDAAKGFGFVTSDEGGDVFLPKGACPPASTS